MSLIRLMIGLLLLALAASTTTEAAKTDFEAIRDVEVFLEKKMEGSRSDDVPEMMEKLVNKLKKEKKGHLFRKKNNSLVNVLKLLTELKLIDEADGCSVMAYEVLKKCDRITDGNAHRKWSPNEKHRLVDKIVHHYGTKRAMHCLPVYAKKYEEVMAGKLVGDFQEYMQPFLTRVILRQICGHVPDTNNLDACGSAHDTTTDKLAGVRNFTPGDAVVILEELLMRSSREDAEELREAIMESTHNENKHHRAQKKIRSLVEKHFVGQCRKFVHHLPHKLFDQVEFDAKMLDKSAKSESLAAFHVGWANYRLCQSLISEPEWLGKFILDDAAAHNDHGASYNHHEGGHHYSPRSPPRTGGHYPSPPHHHYPPPSPRHFSPHHS